MRKSYWCLLLAIAFYVSSPTVSGDFNAGLSALQRAHYATAMRAWIGMANDGIAEAQNNVGHLYEEGFGAC